MSIPNKITAGIMLLVALQTQGCGRKSPLFLPPVAAQAATVAKAQAVFQSATSQAAPNHSVSSPTI